MTSKASAENLAKLLLIQSMVSQLPDEETILAFVREGLEEMPGVECVEVQDPESPVEPKNDSDVYHFALQQENRSIAEIVVTVDDDAQFRPYLAFIKNLCFTVAVVLEERRLRRIAQQHHEELERRVAERTRQLTAEVRERKAAAKALREKQRDLDHAQAVAHIGNWRLNLRRNDLFWSEEVYRIFGVEKGVTMSYENFLSRIHPEDRSYVTEQWEAALEGKPYDIDHRILVRGTVKWVREKAELEFDENGELLGGFGTVQDISDRKRLEFDLLASMKGAQEANRVKSQFLANMSHELRTPLTVIMGALQLLEGETNPVDRQRLLEMAEGSAEQLLCIITDLLDFSCLDAGRLKIEYQPYDPADCIRKTVEMFTESARERGLDLELEIAGDLPARAVGDPNRLRQVLLNLLGNAVKFTERGGVKVRATRRESNMNIDVSDSGIGIPQEKTSLIFDPFTQIDGSLTRPYGGTGLGLTISRELIELMGGRIEVQSEPGRGSTFTFSLPLDGKPAHSENANAEIPGSPCEALRVLVAEDEPTVRELIKLVLGRRGIEVVTADNGRQAVTRCAEGRFDLVLMDLQMPDMDGLEATRRIRQKESECQRRTCIFALTAHTRSEDRGKCFEAGMDGFLSKPIRLEDLDLALQNCACDHGKLKKNA